MSKKADAPNNCPGCGTPLKNAGAPIGDDYCPNDDCRLLVEEIRRQISSAMEARRRDAKIRDAARDLLEALEKLLACPAIADGNHSEPAWGCKETAEAEAFARAAISKATGGE
ncbi:hypothetical protein GN330_22815 [Nitratireductor sp. CAU 1489]|uniref:Uncharacterized protein n=1 Tax=Nitratireductor arenosus TaxID=2682096 RepID=A0A844QQJ7_9HYPH|nr:hypothetical protein [Nitratireductor arenosus]MVB00082.1 hypothetical protein [Nitratireductor arenosus]